MSVKLIPDAAEYSRVFDEERARTYPVIDALEAEVGFAIDRHRLEQAARVLACPVKVNPPNWQHGRVIYALARELFASEVGSWRALDIGTAKGFSALCLSWAAADAECSVWVTSVDVIDPQSHARRNTVAECGGLKTLAEILAPWPESRFIEFQHATGIEWLQRHTGRLRFAFVDGKHDQEVVRQEGRLVAARQQPGDLVLFDDVQIPGVAAAVRSLEDVYRLSLIAPSAGRQYAKAVRR